MNNNQQFDDHIKEQFSNYAPDVHPRIWENIIAEKEKRKPIGFWPTLLSNKNSLLLISLLLAGSIGSFLIIKNNNVPVNTQTATEKNKPTANSQTELTTKTLPTNNSNPEKDNTPIILNENNSTATNTTTTKINTEKISTEKITTTKTGTATTATDKTSANKKTTLPTRGKTKARIYSSPVLNDNGRNTTSNIKPGPKKKRHTEPGNVNIDTESPELTDEVMPWQGTLLGRLTFEAERVSAGNKTKTRLPLNLKPVNFLPGCPKLDNVSGNKKYFEVYAGPDFGFRSLTDTANSVYLQKRKESTKFSSAYSAGIRYTKVFNNSMSVRAGFNYSQINEKFTFTQGNLVQVTYIINAAGDTTGSYTTTGTRYKTTINKYRSIDIPVLIGYELGNGRLHANINAGVVVNIYSWQKGDVLDKNLQPVSITTGKSSSPYQFKTNAGVGFMGAVSVYYKLNDKLHIMAEPYFRYNFSPMNKDNMTLKQKYQTLGLRLGIRLDIK